jgi:hypothetical protein
MHGVPASEIRVFPPSSENQENLVTLEKWRRPGSEKEGSHRNDHGRWRNLPQPPSSHLFLQSLFKDRLYLFIRFIESLYLFSPLDPRMFCFDKRQNFNSGSAWLNHINRLSWEATTAWKPIGKSNTIRAWTKNKRKPPSALNLFVSFFIKGWSTLEEHDVQLSG